MHKFLSQHDDAVIVIAVGETPGRTSTVFRYELQTARRHSISATWLPSGWGSPFSPIWRDREFSRVFAIYPAYDLVFISVARVAGFRRVASPESRGCLASFHEKLASERARERPRVLSSGL